MRKRVPLVALLLTLAAGCATTFQVDTYEAPDSGIAARRTFAWAGGELGTVATVNPATVADADRHIRDAVVAGLVRKGYQEVSDPASAQMLVSYQVAGSRKYVTSAKPRFYAPPTDVLSATRPPSAAASELPPEQQVSEGSVIVFVDDPVSGRLIWRGAITTETRSASKRQGLDALADLAANIVESFPRSSAAPQK